jgi:hypothetical protein
MAAVVAYGQGRYIDWGAEYLAQGIFAPILQNRGASALLWPNVLRVGNKSALPTDARVPTQGFRLVQTLNGGSS